MILRVASWLVSEWPRQLKQEINLKYVKNFGILYSSERDQE